MKEFHGRVVAPGCVSAPALVSHGGLNTLASFQKALQFGDKTATCGDQNNPDLYGKPMAGKALCLTQTIGSTTGGLVLYCACSMNRQLACLMFSNPIDSLAADGSVLAAVWLDNAQMPAIDCLGEEFLDFVQDGMTITVKEDGTVQVEAPPSERGGNRCFAGKRRSKFGEPPKTAALARGRPAALLTTQNGQGIVDLAAQCIRRKEAGRMTEKRFSGHANSLKSRNGLSAPSPCPA